MTTTTDIILDAYRESNIIAITATPSAAQSAEAMRRLANLVSSVYGDDVGENLQDWMVGYQGQQYPDYSWTPLRWQYPISQSRILFNDIQSQTLYLPRRPDDGARIQFIDVQGVCATYPVTLSANGRLIEGADSITLSTDGVNKTWIYKADIATWVLVETLALDDEMPFPPEFDDYFIIKLAGRMNPRYGRSLDEFSLARLQEMQDNLESKYRQKRSMPAQQGVLRLSDPNQQYFYAGNRRGQWGWML